MLIIRLQQNKEENNSQLYKSIKSRVDNLTTETELRLRSPRPQHWYTMAVGRSKFHISLTTNTQSKKIGCEIYIRGHKAKKAFSLLESHKSVIEAELGPLEWQELPEGQDCRIIQYRDGDSKSKPSWPELHQWLKDRSESFHKVFSPLIKSLDLNDDI